MAKECEENNGTRENSGARLRRYMGSFCCLLNNCVNFLGLCFSKSLVIFPFKKKSINLKMPSYFLSLPISGWLVSEINYGYLATWIAT